MTQDEKHAVALMRFGTIAPLVSGTKDDSQSLDDYYRQAAAKTWPAPDGSQKQFSAASIERWYRAYLKDGFDALLPKSRSDSGKTRCLDEECQEFIRHMKTSYPRMPASMIYRALLGNGLLSKTAASESSVNRFVNRLMAENTMTNNRDMRRYERPHINEVVVRQIKRGCFRQIKTVRQEASGKHHVTLLSVYSAHWKKQQTTHAD